MLKRLWRFVPDQDMSLEALRRVNNLWFIVLVIVAVVSFGWDVYHDLWNSALLPPAVLFAATAGRLWLHWRNAVLQEQVGHWRAQRGMSETMLAELNKQREEGTVHVTTTLPGPTGPAH